MKKYIAILLLMLSTLCLGTPAYAEFQKGLDAYHRKDYATAFKEWMSLADSGKARAQNAVGMLYEDGEGVEQDYKEALKWFKCAAAQGSPRGQNSLGRMYLEGNGVIQDYKEAVKWYKLSAESGRKNAQFSLGRMYRNGHGVIQDNTRAHMWFNIAASQGHEIAISQRDVLTRQMTSDDISKAQDMARKCVAKKYKDC